MTWDMAADFGALRELTHSEPTIWRFARIWDLCERALRDDVTRARDEVLPFATDRMRRWPGRIRPLSSAGFVQWLDGTLSDELIDLVGSLSNHGYDLTAAELERVAELTRRVTPTHLEITHVTTSEDAWRAFFDTADLSAVEVLELQSNASVAPSGLANVLADASDLPSLRRIDLSSHTVSPGDLALIDAAAWAHRVRELILTSGYRAGHLGSLFDATNLIDGLEHLELKWSHLNVEELQALATSPQLLGLESLKLRSCNIDDDGIIALAKSPMRSLKALDVGNSKFGDRGLDALASSEILNSVRELYVGQSNATAESLRELGASRFLGSLEVLGLYNAASGAASAAIDGLALNPRVTSLRRLSATNNIIEPAAIEQLAARKDIGELERLDGAFWCLDARTWRALFESRLGRGIRQLDLSYANLGAQPQELFSGLDMDVRVLCCDGASELEHCAGEMFAERAFDRLESLDIGYVKIDGASLDSLARMPLRRVRFDQNALGDAPIISILARGGFADVEELIISRNDITGALIEALCAATHMRSLRSLQLWENDGIGDSLASLFGSHHMETLEKLTVNETGLTDSGLSRSLLQMKRPSRVEVFDISANKITSAGFSALMDSPNFPALRTLYANSCDVRDSGARALARTPYFKRAKTIMVGSSNISTEARREVSEARNLSESVRQRWAR